MDAWPKLQRLALDPSVEQWAELTGTIQDFLQEELDLLGTQAVLQTEDAPPRAEDLQTFLKSLFSSGFNAAHPGFMAYIPGGGLVTSALADWIVKTMNRYGTAHFAAPRLADLEFQVVETFARWIGYGPGFAGVLTTGGSLANFTALVTARRARLPENFLLGILYCSDQTHHSVMKAANLAGFSARNIRIVASDADFRIDTAALKRQIAADRSDGLTPFFLVGSAGTTNTGSVDPMSELALIAQAEGLWYHVDAAYGGAFLLTDRGQKQLAGIAEADSVTLDPHKGLFLPYGTGGILVKDRDSLIEAHELRGEYMPDLDRSRAHLDPFSLSVELSREHRGLKVALPLMLHGEDAFSEALDEKLDLAQYAFDEMSNCSHFQLLNKPDLSTFAFRLVSKTGTTDDSEGLNRHFLDEINSAGKVYLSGTVLDGEFAVRISILSHRTHREQIVTLLEELDRAASCLVV
ncbi:MAG: decarboxylase [Pseudomonadales bacterium]|nr:decarboxylase [Pseudomonadales bacterium]